MVDTKSVNIKLRLKLRECTPLLQALADANRQEIFFLLLAQGRMNVKEIALSMSISRPAISHHLKIMRQASVLEYEKCGTQKYYSINRREGDALSGLRALAALIGETNS